MKRTLFIILSVVGVFLLLGTLFVNIASRRAGLFSTAAPDVGYGGGAPEFFEAPAAAEPASEAFGADTSAESANRALQGQERLIIENADLAIVVADPKASQKKISDLAREFGGFVVSSNIYQSSSPAGIPVPEASIVIRVPSERLDEALTRIKQDAIEIDFENRSGQDVTNQYIDLQSQLKAKEAAEQKLLEIMEQATRAEDVLAIYLQVQNVQTEIEQLKGQIQYLEESAALSAISVRLIAEEGTQPLEVGPWKPQGAVREAIQDLIFFFQSFVDFLIRFALYTLPALILLAIPLYLLFLGGRGIYRRARRSNQKNERDEEIKK